MAPVHGISHISPPGHRSSAKHAPRSHAPMVPDPYHGHEALAKTAAHFVAHLFTCPEYPPPVQGAPQMSIRLDLFIAYALHRTRLNESVTFASLYLLQRLKARFPAAKGSSGHRLFISAYMLASKIICDDTYSNKSWCIVAQHMFQLREINQMEREMCSYLEWQLNVNPGVLQEFQSRVKRDFAGPGPYPPLILPQDSTPEPASAASSMAPFSSRPSVTPFPAPIPPQVSSPTSSDEDDSSSPNTPEVSNSTTPSPASTASPSTPPDIVSGYPVEIAGEQPRVVRPSRSRLEKPSRHRSPPPAPVISAPLPQPTRVREIPAADPYAAASERDDAIVAPRGQRKRGVSPSGARSKLTVGRDMYAYAARTVW